MCKYLAIINSKEETHVKPIADLIDLASVITEYKSKGYEVLEQDYLVKSKETNLSHLYGINGKGVCLITKYHEIN